MTGPCSYPKIRALSPAEPMGPYGEVPAFNPTVKFYKRIGGLEEP